LKSIDLSKATGLKNIGGDKSGEGFAFAECANLASVVFPEGATLTRIGYNAFRNCTALTEIAWPAGVKTIEYYTFYGCTALAEITLPQSLTTIGDDAFSGCAALGSITIPA
jgi:hypothetical protein